MYSENKRRFKDKFKNVIVLNLYAPTNQQLTRKIRSMHKGNIQTIIRDINAKVRMKNYLKEHIMPKHAIGVVNDNGMRLV